MHTIELFEEAIAAAEQLGYMVRQEWLDGIGGGGCEIGGQKWIFLDLALNTAEQLDLVKQSLIEDQGIFSVSLSPALCEFLGIRSAA